MKCIMDNYAVSTGCTCFDGMTRKKLTGIGGWLVIMIIHLVASFFYNIFGFFSVAFSSVDSEVLKEPLEKSLFYANGAIEFMTSVIAILTIIAFFLKKKKFKGYYQLFVFSSFLYPILVVSASYFMFGYVDNFWPLIIVYLFVYPVAMVYICLLYLESSKRVRLTFVN